MNFNFTKTPIGIFRLVGIIEGISYLSLLLIGMPLKYMAGIPQTVKLMGWIHGLLFIAYVIALIRVSMANKWSIMKIAIAFITSLLPAGTFILDKKLKQEEQTTT